MSAPEWISIQPAVQISGCSAQYIRRIIRQQKVKASKLPGMREWLIDHESMRDYKRQMDRMGTEKHNPHGNGD